MKAYRKRRSQEDKRSYNTYERVQEEEKNAVTHE